MKNSVLNELQSSISKNELVIVIGSGVSVASTDRSNKELSWTGLIKNGLNFAKEKGKLTQQQLDTWTPLLDSSDMDDILSAAEYVGRKLDSPDGDLYARWLNHCFQASHPTNEAIIKAVRKISDAGIPICTLNYDSILETITGLQTILLSDIRKSSAWMRGEESGILHLHGHWKSPETCILGIRDYEKTLDNEPRDLFQRHLGSYRRLLFIGCGDTFSDPNFTSLISWLRSKMKGATLQHYALVVDSQCATRNADNSWHGFVDPLGYGESHSDLPNFIVNLIDTGPITAPKKKTKRNGRNEKDSKLLANYREFLIRDCGQMTIEGMRVDSETAQRRFDIERLFVPLELLPSPPDISLDDALREEKLEAWRQKNKDPQSFGSVFKKTKGLALLALPGGGKSLLLKRLAVAYASPERRLNSDDNLPDIDITPLLIRCREWRDYIKSPIATLLKSLPDITGQPNLEGLSTALLPLFGAGKILLLVDGLDEIHDDSDRTIFVENLRNFIDQHPQTRIVVTSREAGFSLVAPYLATYCEQWKVAPLSASAIRLLIGHWHRLMAGGSPEALEESAKLSSSITSSIALNRLAENPLLLTMLLVVKHGAGRLPPDRVTLYMRAVEVLLDTWNIKGHDALNTKEAIPQLAYIAYELMLSGQQTATEKELLAILEKARKNVPQINRYAKDTPYEFLKRVELRSSLLLEAGHQVENGRIVPFYQFRHLTFQEYLAALAIAEGHFDEYDNKTSIVKPLHGRLASDEWKEVVPMTAVLAGKRAEPLIKALVQQCNLLKRKCDAGKNFAGKAEWLHPNGVLPGVVGRLVQSLIEEAEAEPTTLTAGLRLVAYFARGCQFDLDWKALCRGPYAQELISQSLQLYMSMECPQETWIRNSCASFAAYSKPSSYWVSPTGQEEIHSMLQDDDIDRVSIGVMTCVGVLWNSKGGKSEFSTSIASILESLILIENKSLAHVALWAWGLHRHRAGSSEVESEAVADYVFRGYLSNSANANDLFDFALGTLKIPRNAWIPEISSAELEVFKEKAKSSSARVEMSTVLVAFYTRTIWSDRTLVRKLIKTRETWARRKHQHRLDVLDNMLLQISPDGVSYLDSERRKQENKQKEES